MIEEWRPFPGLNGSYEVSSLGNIRSLDRVVRCNYKTGRKVWKFYPGKLLALRVGPNGYQFYLVSHGGKKYVGNVSRLVCRTFHGEPSGKDLQAAHNNGVRHDDRAENLRWATPLENAQDTILHGTRLRGTQVAGVTLGEDDVRAIRAARAAGVRGVALAAKYGVTPANISRVTLRQSWAWVD